MSHIDSREVSHRPIAFSEKWRYLVPNFLRNSIPKEYRKRVTVESEGSRGYSFLYQFSLWTVGGVSHIDSREVSYRRIAFSEKWRYLVPNCLRNSIPKEYGKRVTAKSEGSR